MSTAPQPSVRSVPTTLQQVAAGSDWIEPPGPAPKPQPMRVKVLLDFGGSHTYEGLFRTKWDAIDDAIARFPRAARVVPTAIPHLSPKGRKS